MTYSPCYIFRSVFPEFHLRLRLMPGDQTEANAFGFVPRKQRRKPCTIIGHLGIPLIQQHGDHRVGPLLLIHVQGDYRRHDSPPDSKRTPKGNGTRSGEEKEK